MNEEVFSEIKNAMRVISMLQLREKTFREELDFFNLKCKIVCKEYSRSLYAGALRRLEHEVGFLCVDTYSLYQGIKEKKSLYSKIIKQNGKLLSKTDKTPSDRNNYEFLGCFNSDGEMRPFTIEEKNDLIEKMEEEAYKCKEALKKDSGITSHQHSDLDEWINKVLDDKILSQLEQYRKEFAHRLDSLDNLKRELEIRQPQDIQEMIDTVSVALNSYFKCFQNILNYAKSQHYLGVKGLEYDSLSRLKLADSILEKEKPQDEEDLST
ncbi:MAG: hypothetical protein RLZZ04_4669 [Cyanobacteriota bacterium]|jgi:hypothetical protein